MRVEMFLIVATVTGAVAFALMAYAADPMIGLLTYAVFAFEMLMIMVAMAVRGWLR